MLIIGLFRRKNRTTPEERAQGNILTLEGLISASEQITREQALEIPTVAACISKVGETIARLPVKLYRRDSDQIFEITDDPRLRLLNGETGDTLSSVDMWKAAAEDYYLGRGAWLYINSDALGVKSLHYVDSRCVSIMSGTDPIFKAFRVMINGQSYYDFRFVKLLRKTKNGFDSTPLQADSNIILSAAYNALKLENAMSANGGCQPGFLKSQKHLSQEAINGIKSGYRSMYSNDRSNSRVVVLNEGIDFQPASSTAAELQLNENKRANSVEICKLFGFPHTVIDGGASEDDNKKFVAAVISLLNQIETELDRVLLLESEKEQGYYWAFDTKELTRGSLKERFEAYEIARRNNILQVDEIRREEDYEPLGFNYITLGLADVLLDPETMEVFTPNTGKSRNLLTGEERAQWIKGEHGYFAGSVGGLGGGGHSAGAAKKSYSNGGSSGKSGLTKSQNDVKLDSNGIPFRYRAVKLPKKEYANVMDEIGRNWNSKYEGKEICRLKFTNKTYFFENRGIGDYNIYHVEKG